MAGESSNNFDATDPKQLCAVVEVVNPLQMAARLNVNPQDPPPSMTCPINPAGVPNGGQACLLSDGDIAQSLVHDLPTPPPTMSAEANSAFQGPDQILPAPELKI